MLDSKEATFLYRMIMIPIDNVTKVHREIIEAEADTDFEGFMLKLYNILKRFEDSVFYTPNMNLYKAVLIGRWDIDKEKKYDILVNDILTHLIIKNRIRVVIDYRFKPLGT